MEECSRCGSLVFRGEKEVEIESECGMSTLVVYVEAVWCENCDAYKIKA